MTPTTHKSDLKPTSPAANPCGAVGRKAQIINSTGQHSQQFIGSTGVAKMKLIEGSQPRWVIRFSSSLRGNKEGLYDDSELRWID